IILQEYISGIGCAYFALLEQGEIKLEFGHMRVRENPPSGGASTSCQSYYHEKLYHYGRTLLQYTRYNGVVMVEFKYNPAKDDFWLIEVNPKFWGSLLLSVASKVNFPLEYVHLLEGKKIEQPKYTPKTIQFLVPDLRRAFKYKKNIGQTIAGALNPTITKDVFFLGMIRYLRFSFGKLVCK
ncbi:MAG: ATP-grasp domain-containing protein, partial [Cytophagales bacterium]|nr:ATP-grasp domain-containing protein [Cytophagales bacterium]